MSKRKTKHLQPPTREIYVLLSYPPTLIARVIGLYTRRGYTHASIALDKEFKQLYSFGRRLMYFPLIGGFIHENPSGGVFALSENISCKVFKIQVTEHQYKMVEDTIKGFVAERGKYKYNFLGLLGIILNRKIPVKDRYFCSEFVAKVLLDNGIPVVDKHPGFVRPDDFLEAESLEEIYSGTLTTYLSSTQHL